MNIKAEGDDIRIHVSQMPAHELFFKGLDQNYVKSSPSSFIGILLLYEFGCIYAHELLPQSKK